MNLIQLDQNVFSWVNSLAQQNIILDDIVKTIAVYGVYLVPILMLFFFWWRPNEKRQNFLINLFGTSIISWAIITPIIGNAINRSRPYDVGGAHELVFHLPSYSFPSDHALFFAYVATYLFLFGYKKWGWIALCATILVSLSRVIAGLHWPGDVLAGWILGIIFAYLFYLARKPLEKYIINPIYSLLKRIRVV